MRSYERRIKDLESELAKAYRDIVNIRDHWFEVLGDLEKELQAYCEQQLCYKYFIKVIAFRQKI